MGTSVVHVRQIPIAQIALHKLVVPFSITIANSRTATFADIQLKVASQVPGIMFSFWDVSSECIHRILTLSWAEFSNSIRNRSAVQCSIYKNGIQITATQNEIIKLGVPEGELQLDVPPRKKYPLVVCFLKEEEPNSLPDVMSLLVIVHIKDNECTFPTAIIHQYIKQYCGQVTTLQPLYTQGNEDSYENLNQNVNVTEQEQVEGEYPEVHSDVACVVCQVERITRALLPCRHVCICKNCFSLLDMCPMCRTKITCYFLVGEEPQQNVAEIEHREVSRSEWLTGEIRRFWNELVHL